MQRVGDLEINQDVRFHEREWRVERIGWTVILLLVVVAFLGLFGHGPISWTTASADDGTLEVTFERFGRRGGTQALEVWAPASAAEGGEWQVEIERDYASGVQFKSISPQPKSVETVPGAIRYVFAQGEPTSDLQVVFDLTPDSLWGVDGDVRLVGNDAVTVEQFFFP